jgi:hypothetical protein
MTNDSNISQKVKAKTLEISQLLSELNSFVQSSDRISPSMQHMLEEKVDKILTKVVQLLRLTKST